MLTQICYVPIAVLHQRRKRGLACSLNQGQPELPSSSDLLPCLAWKVLLSSQREHLHSWFYLQGEHIHTGHLIVYAWLVAEGE